jgi:hypothetical protein
MDLSDVKFQDTYVEAGCNVTSAVTGLPAGVTPVWLEVPDELSGDLVVTRIRVGHKCQLNSTGAVPLELFSRGAPRDELLVDPVDLHTGILDVSVSNLSSEKRLFSCRLVLSDDSTRLARYRRASLVGLGASKISPLGSLNVIVQPQAPLDPDRLFVPRGVLDRVDVEGVEAHKWSDERGADGLLDSTSPEYCRRSNLEKDGIFHLDRLRSVGPGECLVVKFRNRTSSEVLVRGAILGGRPLPSFP